MTRTWTLPATARFSELRFDIREPPLTGDNLGFKTWGTAYALALKLEHLGQTYLRELMDRRDAFTTLTGDTILLPSTKGTFLPRVQRRASRLFDYTRQRRVCVRDDSLT